MLLLKCKKYYSIWYRYLFLIYNIEINESNKGVGCININFFNIEIFYINGLVFFYDIYLYYVIGILLYYYFKIIFVFIN